MNKALLIRELKGTEQSRRLIVEEQSDKDIIKEVVKAHKENAADYDRISDYFAGGSIYDICDRLWTFCKTNLIYKIESVKVQNVGCPYWILTHEIVDCKNYASFIAGVLDSLKRHGLRVIWEFRFISDRFFSLFDRMADHVFVVCNPATEDIWVDPVLNNFNDHIYYFYRASRRVSTSSGHMQNRLSRVGAMGGMGCGCEGGAIGSSAENSLLASVLSYSQGLSGAIIQTQKTSLFNVISESVLLGVATAVLGPIALIGLAALKAGAAALDKEFGVGSTSAMLLTDISNLNVTALVNTIFNGRTYNTDQYWAGVYYQNYVLGLNVTNETFVSDQDVLPALKWFIDRTGVFISGRQHIIALTQGVSQYIAYHSANPDTTTDTTLVAAAVRVAKRYFINPGSYSASTLKSWANTIGVYDQTLINLAASYGMTPEQYTAATGTQDQVAQGSIEPAILTWLKGSTLISNVPNWILLAAGGGILIFALSKSKK